MGKPKSNNKKLRKLQQKHGASPNKPEYSLNQILDKAEEFMDEYKYEMAQKFCQRALEMEADNVRALQLSASLLLELGQVESAQQCLGRAVFLQPHTGHTKYMTLAQLFSGTEARDLYLKGIEIISKQLADSSSSSDPNAAASSDPMLLELRKELSNGYVSLSEIYMTDLCDNPEAEAEAKRFIQLAIEADSGNPESFQALANYSLVTGAVEEAKTAMQQSLALWLPSQLLFLEKGEGEETSLSYSFRLSTAKILLDLEEFDTATKLLESLVEEDEEVVAAWYLMGWMNFLRNDPDYHGNVRYYLSKAQAVNTINPTDDEAMVQHIQEILAEVGEAKDEESSEAMAEAATKEKIVVSGEEVDTIAQIFDAEAGEEDAVETMED